MLQQTQVTTVIPYFERFIEKLPDVENLAAASIDDVLNLWSGLGYYARGRNLHKTARLIVDQGGQFPIDLDGLCALPGIGKSTAGAILAMAFSIRASILDGNVKRVLARFHAVTGWSGDARVNEELWRLSDEATPENRVGDYTQAIMDLGASVCKRKSPDCFGCPVREGCIGYRDGLIDEIPMPRPTKKLLEKKVYFLILRNKEGRVLLEKRPPTGIWGGLWSFPEYTDKVELVEQCIKYSIEPPDLLWMNQHRHTFSHYHLDYTPVLLECSAFPNHVMDKAEHLWYGISKKNTCGLPAPIRRLIQQLENPD